MCGAVFSLRLRHLVEVVNTIIGALELQRDRDSGMVTSTLPNNDSLTIKGDYAEFEICDR